MPCWGAGSHAENSSVDCSLLSEHVLAIDYQRGEIRCSTNSAQEGWPIYFVHGKPKIAVEGNMEGASRELFRIDTGSDCCELTDAYVDSALAGGALWDVSDPRKETAAAIGEAQEREERLLADTRFRPVGGWYCLSLRGLPIGTWLPDLVISYAGKLGSDAFRGRVLELDYPACRMRLSPLESEA
ncbi:hypothetical protein ACFLSW_01680 [Candidatus Bipolaricaulota bacterium]